MADPKVRLFVKHPLAVGQSCLLTRDQVHYLFEVMRFAQGDALTAFNGCDGEFLALATRTGRHRGTLSIERQTAPLRRPPDLWLLFAPVKSARTDFIVEKATEMGVARLQPVRTCFTNTERVRQDRLQRRVIEAVEQCGGSFVPDIGQFQPLDSILADWPEDRRLLFCDEALTGASEGLDTSQKGKWAILIGPEGGFSDAERQMLAALPYVTRISLGPRILRSDTAAVAALALWQSNLGDW